MSFLFKLERPREFKYTPRYYQPPDEADEESGKRRIHFRQILRHHRAQRKTPALWILLVVVLLYVYWHLNRSTLSTKPIQVEQIKVEEIVP
ncbi:MAG: hypothetical protein ONA90_05125 [candidate division KSB1 bacterium]|nr:hypothetical protein [candidate division KSB1 bacterium]